MKKIFMTLLLVVFVFTSGCGLLDEASSEDPDPSLPPETITIFSINDLHGIFDESLDTAGLAKITTYIKNNTDENTIILSAGDMFQGTALSSMTRGKAMVEAMNVIGFDAMTIGNHEFDWGIEKINEFQDGNNENGEADFPFIVANIIDNNTNELASWAKPYAVIEKGKYKIGIVGVIGSDQKSDILTSYVKDYTFTDELEAIRKYTKILRTTEECDLVIVSAHLDTSDINNRLANQTDEYKVDAIINGHTHRSYYGEISRDAAPLSYVQSSAYGRYLGETKIVINPNTKETIDSYSNNLSTSTSSFKSLEEDSEILKIYNNYSSFIDASNEVLGVSGAYITKATGGIWAANTIKKVNNSQIGIVNQGGIRANGFPISEGETITYGSVFEIMPFENTVVTLTLTGDTLIDVLDRSDIFVSDNVVITPSSITIDGVEVSSSSTYTIATIDFLFEKTNYPFERYGTNVVRTGYLFRDVLADNVKEQMANYDSFLPNRK